MKSGSEANKGRHMDWTKLLAGDIYLTSLLSVLLLVVSCDTLVLSSGRISDNQGFVQPVISFSVLFLRLFFQISV